MIKNHPIFTFKPETFYNSKDISFPLWRTEEDANLWWPKDQESPGARTAAQPYATVALMKNTIFYCVRIVEERTNGHRGIVQVISGEFIGFLVYQHYWTGLEPLLTP